MTRHYLEKIIERQTAIIGGENWLGECFKNKIAGLSEEAAFQKPLVQIHSVAELISHLTVWKEENFKKLNGNPPTLTDDSPENWKKNEVLKEIGWKTIKEDFFNASKRLTDFLNNKDDTFLEQESNAIILEGLIQHDIYHLGQIGIAIKLINNP